MNDDAEAVPIQKSLADGFSGGRRIRGLSSLLPDVTEHGKDVPMLLAVHLVHLDTVLGSEVNIELALEIPCVRSEVVLPGGL